MTNKKFAAMTGEELWDWFCGSHSGTYDSLAALASLLETDR